MLLTWTRRPGELPLVLMSLPPVEELSGYTAPARPTAVEQTKSGGEGKIYHEATGHQLPELILISIACSDA